MPLIILAFILGIPLFLLMEHPVIFWLVFVPVALLIALKFMLWLRG